MRNLNDINNNNPQGNNNNMNVKGNNHKDNRKGSRVRVRLQKRNQSNNPVNGNQALDQLSKETLSQNHDT